MSRDSCADCGALPGPSEVSVKAASVAPALKIPSPPPEVRQMLPERNPATHLHHVRYCWRISYSLQLSTKSYLPSTFVAQSYSNIYDRVSYWYAICKINPPKLAYDPQTAHFAAMAPIEGLPDEILTDTLNHLDDRDIHALMITNKTLYRRIQISQYDIHRHLKHYVSDTHGFLELLEETHGLVVGDVALDFFDRFHRKDSKLWILLFYSGSVQLFSRKLCALEKIHLKVTNVLDIGYGPFLVSSTREIIFVRLISKEKLLTPRKRSVIPHDCPNFRKLETNTSQEWLDLVEERRHECSKKIPSVDNINIVHDQSFLPDVVMSMIPNTPESGSSFQCLTANNAYALYPRNESLWLTTDDSKWFELGRAWIEGRERRTATLLRNETIAWKLPFLGCENRKETSVWMNGMDPGECKVEMPEIEHGRYQL